MAEDFLTKLEKLAIEEVSGVDKPANALDGWAVLKSRNPIIEQVGDDIAFGAEGVGLTLLHPDGTQIVFDADGEIVQRADSPPPSPTGSGHVPSPSGGGGEHHSHAQPRDPAGRFAERRFSNPTPATSLIEAWVRAAGGTVSS
jgi:hypothetical protein